jgi:hypothetical protein
MGVKRAVVAVMVVLLLSTAAWAAGMGAAKGKEVTITGKISCTYCNLPGPMECTKECCSACVKSGDPVLLSDAEGNLYILLSGEKGKPFITEERMKLIQEKVKVQGMLVKRGGVQAIYVKTLEKAN